MSQSSSTEDLTLADRSDSDQAPPSETSREQSTTEKLPSLSDSEPSSKKPPARCAKVITIDRSNLLVKILQTNFQFQILQILFL